MTAQELLDHLQVLGVELAPAPDSMLQVRAPHGTLTPLLVEALRTAKPELVALLTDPQPQATEPTRSYRQWVTGKIPQTAVLPIAEPLLPPKYHDTPSPCKTYTGRPCTVKACTGNRTRFWPTRMCTQCWERAKKCTTMSTTPD
jgi:hypothetical protein